MPLRIGQDLQQETPGGGIAVAELADQGGVGRHLLPFEHKVLNDHLPQCGALLGTHPHACRLCRAGRGNRRGRPQTGLRRQIRARSDAPAQRGGEHEQASDGEREREEQRTPLGGRGRKRWARGP